MLRGAERRRREIDPAAIVEPDRNQHDVPVRIGVTGRKRPVIGLTDAEGGGRQIGSLLSQTRFQRARALGGRRTAEHEADLAPVHFEARTRQVMRDAVAFRPVGQAGDRALDRDDALGEAAVAPGRGEALDADAEGPIAEQVEGEQGRDQDQDRAARHGVGPEASEQSRHADCPSSRPIVEANR